MREETNISEAAERPVSKAQRTLTADVRAMDLPVMREFIERVQGFVGEYAWHDRSCPAIDADKEWRRGNAACGCGYDDALASLVPEGSGVEYEALLAVAEAARRYVGPLQYGRELRHANELGDVLRSALDALDVTRGPAAAEKEPSDA